MSPAHDTQQNLINTAAKLFYEKSYVAVGINEICQTANVKKGSFYYFFNSKQTLALKVIDTLWVNFHDGFITAVLFENERPVPERFYRFFELTALRATAMLERNEPIKGCHFGNLAVEMSTQDEQIRIRLAEVFEIWTQVFADTLQIGIERGEISADLDITQQAGQILTIFEGAAVLGKTFNNPAYLINAGHLVQQSLELKNS